MSYILDALRKSEQERSQGPLPNLKPFGISENHQEPYNAPAKTWMPVYIILTLVLLTALVALLWLKGAAPEPEQSGRDMTLAKVEPAPAAEPRILKPAPLPVQKPVRTPIDNVDSYTADSLLPPVKKPALSTPAKKVVPEQKQRSNVIFLKEEIADEDLYSQEPYDISSNSKTTPVPDKVPEPEVVGVSDLPAAIRNKLPSMSFSGHVFSSTPKRRSVIINDKKMREGEFVTSEVRLEKITEKAAVFSYEGYYFSLGALQDWGGR